MDRILSIWILVAFASVVVFVGLMTRSGDEGSAPTAETAFDLPATGTEEVRFEKLPWVVGSESEKFIFIIWPCDEALQSCEALREWSACAEVCSEAWAEGD